MKKDNKITNKQTKNPYEKDFDDANRLLKKIGDMDFLNSIPDDYEQKNPSIPFPYGNNVVRPYNFN